MDPKVYIPQPIPEVALNRLKTMAMRTVDNIEAMIQGRRPPDLLNPEVAGEPPLDTGDRLG
jgi:hypothetical protein